MTPTRPGRYLVRYDTGVEAVYVVDLARDHYGRPGLFVLDEERSTSSTPWVRANLEDFTTILGTVGGEWVERVGDYPGGPGGIGSG
jgi:hypothetical protein